MKKHIWLFLVMTLILILLSFNISYASENTNEVLITSGDIYELLMTIDSHLVVKDLKTEAGNHMLNIERNFSDAKLTTTIEAYAKNAMRDIVKTLDVEAIWKAYDTVSYSFFLNECFLDVIVNDYKDIYNFTTMGNFLIGSDISTKKIFNDYYYKVFGAHDWSNIFDKSLYDLSKDYGTPGYSLPESYQNGYLWAYSAFENLKDVSFEDNILTIYTTAQDNMFGGVDAWTELEKSIEKLTLFCLTDPDSMQYLIISIFYVHPLSNEELLKCDLYQTKLGTYDVLNFEVNGSDYFKAGVQYSINFESFN